MPYELNIVLRLQAAIFSSIWLVLQTFVLSQGYYGLSNQQMYTGMVYIGIAMAVDLVYFICAYLVILKKVDHCIVKKYWFIWSKNKKLFAISLFCTVMYASIING